MRIWNKNTYKIVVLFGLVFFLSVGYAVVNSVSLSITGTVSSEISGLDVAFTGLTEVSNTTKATATASGLSGVANVTDMTLNEVVTLKYEVMNNEFDVDAELDITVPTGNEYFEISMSTGSIASAASYTASQFDIVNDTYEVMNLATTGHGSTSSGSSTTQNYSIGAQEKIVLVLSVKMIKVPISTDNSSYTFSISIVASPLIGTTSSCCFDPNMRVLMADGTYKKIIDVEVGDMVMSLDEETGEYVAQRVKATIIRKNSDDLVYVYLSNGTKIGMRAYHPLLTTEGWKSLRPEQAETVMDVGEVQLLEVGDTLIGIEGNLKVVAIEPRPYEENYNTYNLSIENTHNYIVEGIVVHNADSDGGHCTPV